MTTIEVMTRSDLEAFKNELLVELKSLITPQHQPAKQWLKSAEVRKLLNISPNTLQNLRISGKLSYTKLGGILYYRYADIIQLLEDSKD